MKGLRFDDAQAAMRVIASGDSAHSPLIAMVTAPAASDASFRSRLSESEVALLRAWSIRAPLADSAAKPGLWSLQPITRPGARRGSECGMAGNGIDRFVLARSKPKVSPSPPPIVLPCSAS